MHIIQPILAYMTLTVAVGYIVYKFFLPKSVFVSKKKSQKGCGTNDCGCH